MTIVSSSDPERMNPGRVEFSRVGARSDIALVTLNRTERANAYTTEMLRDLRALVQRPASETLRAMVVTGAGRNFCAGADRNELDRRRADEGLHLFSREVFDALSAAPFPVIAAVNGPAVAGGFELALAANLRICAPHSLFKLPELSLGLAAAAGGIRRLIDALGRPRAAEIALFERAVDAPTALAWGLVSSVVADPVAEAISRAEAVCARDQLCVAVTKTLLNTASTVGRDSESIAQALLYERRRSLTKT